MNKSHSFKMKMKLHVVLVLCILTVSQAVVREEIVAREYLKNINKELAKRENVATEASWEYNINTTDYNTQVYNREAGILAEFRKEMVKDMEMFNWSTYNSADLRRQFKQLTSLGYSALPADKYSELLDNISTMESNYAKVRVCQYGAPEKCDLSLEPEIETVFETSNDPEELSYYWQEFYSKAGTKVRQNFENYVELANEAAKLNNYPSNAEMWLSFYEDDTFEAQLEKIFETLKPFYDQLHAYVRYKLNAKYGDSIVSKTGPIPMHLLGNMWGQTWREVGDIVAPFPDKAAIDVTEEMLNQGITPIKMFEMADDFFTSMGLKKLPETFWEKSLLEKPTDGRDLVCHASAWDFYLIDDVRIKMCTKVTQDELFTVHHECGHIQYYLQYQHLPQVYRTGANPGFHEAVGDVLSLSVSTPRHLQAVGLLKNYVEDEETRINNLFLNALDKIAFIPFAYTLDKYRWAVFRGEIAKDNMNCAFWKLRSDYSGIEPPVVRTEKDFDPPAKYHISADTEYLRYMVSYIIQFEFYKTACIAAGQYDPTNPELPLDNCDIYGSKAAGDALHNMLSLGASKPWPDVLEAFNGKRTMTADALVEYFAPLQKFLEEENKKNNIPVGWNASEKQSFYN